MKRFSLPQRRRRGQAALFLTAVMMGLLVAAFFRAQVLRSSTWSLQSDSNRLRLLTLPAPRGTIFDRNGLIVADNIPAYSISLLPAPRDSIAASLRRMREHLPMSDARVEQLMATFGRYSRQPLLVTSDAAFEHVAALEERRADFPGLFMEMRPKRRYYGGEAMGHVMGHVGEVSARELETERFQDYSRGMVVGKDGLERSYEEDLQGSQGIRFVEVDAVGRIVGAFEGESSEAPEPGGDLQLHLDLELMEWVHAIFPQGMRGALVALDVEEGGVLALYSNPSFDPNDFVGGIDTETWQKLNEDPARPLFNRAVLGLYPPASTWKLATAAIALDLGVVDAEGHMPVACTGGLNWGNRYWRCWNPRGHGSLNLVEALRDSCNVYFYQLGLRVGLERMLTEATRLGFSNQCGVDLPRESRGIFPAGLDFWEREFGYRANESEVLSLSIGQGPNSQTPLKMAQFYLGLARGGSAPAPRLARTGGDLPDAWTMDLTPENVDWLLEGLRMVVRPGGTAYMSSLEHFDLMGKTGTAQNSDDPETPHAWFAGMAGPWGGDPEIVVVAIVEAGESGSAVAAPLAAKAADFYLRRKHGIPVDSIQTLREHYQAGRPAPWAGRQ